MAEQHDVISEAAVRLAARLPHSVVVGVADSISRHRGLDRRAARQAILGHVPTPDFRDAAAEFLDQWSQKAGNVGSEAAAVALLTAANADRGHRQRQGVEIVWTGPEPEGSRFRHTEQAVLEVVDRAERRLTVVSYAVYRIPRIREALVAAVARGVSIRLIVETPNRIEGQGEYDCLMALGGNVASSCSVYYWPQAGRAKDDNGKVGILHVKCAVADGRQMFLSSANLTEYAFTINMELGLLVTGGSLPEQVDRHFEQLIGRGEFVRVEEWAS